MPTPATTISSEEVGHGMPNSFRTGITSCTSPEPSGLKTMPFTPARWIYGDRKLVFKGMATMAVYAHPDDLLFLRDGALMIQEFNTSRLELTGEPVRLVDHVSSSPVTYNNGGFGIGAFYASAKRRDRVPLRLAFGAGSLSMDRPRRQGNRPGPAGGLLPRPGSIAGRKQAGICAQGIRNPPTSISTFWNWPKAWKHDSPWIPETIRALRGLPTAIRLCFHRHERMP